MHVAQVAVNDHYTVTPAFSQTAAINLEDRLHLGVSYGY